MVKNSNKFDFANVHVKTKFAFFGNLKYCNKFVFSLSRVFFEVKGVICKISKKSFLMIPVIFLIIKTLPRKRIAKNADFLVRTNKNKPDRQ